MPTRGADKQKVCFTVIVKDEDVIRDVCKALVGRPWGANSFSSQIHGCPVGVAYPFEDDLQIVGQIWGGCEVRPLGSGEDLDVEVRLKRVKRKILHVRGGVDLKTV